MGGSCLRGRDNQLGFIEKDRATIWKGHMKKITNGTRRWRLMRRKDRLKKLLAKNCESNLKIGEKSS